MSIARVAIVFVGVTTILLALAGCWYNWNSLFADFSQVQGKFDVPYFDAAFYTMTAVCVLCYVVLLFVGVQLIRGRTNVVRLLVLVLVFEVLYFFAVGSLWLLPDYGMSIAAATGVANGGLMIQAMSLFPIWGPVVAWLATRSIRDAGAPVPTTVTKGTE